jgi:TPR repeat protein
MTARPQLVANHPASTVYVPAGDEFAFRTIREGDYAAGLAASLQLAEQGNVDAKAVAGWMLFIGAGCTRNLVDSERLLEEARLAGSAYAAFGLAWLNYERGEFGRCHVLMLEAAEAGFLPATLDLGRLHLKGIGTRRDHAKAERQYCEAARRGHRMAPVALLRLWTFGRCGKAKAIIGKLAWWPARAICALLVVFKRFDQEGLFYSPPVKQRTGTPSVPRP